MKAVLPLALVAVIVSVVAYLMFSGWVTMAIKHFRYHKPRKWKPNLKIGK